MNEMTVLQLASLKGGGSRNCGTTLQTYVVTTTCGLAGGLIGLAFSGVGGPAGSFLGKAACSWMCYYAC